MGNLIGTMGADIRGGPGSAHGLLVRIRHFYGPCEAELARYAAHAEGAAAVLVACERRLENVVRRAGFTRTRADARRAVVRGHILVNGRKVNHPGYLVRAGEVLTVRPRPHIEALYRPPATTTDAPPAPPDWLAVEPARLRATVVRLPAAADVGLAVDAADVAAALAH